MAGRPNKMAERIGELEDKALIVAGELYLAAPGVYLRPQSRRDPLHAAWGAAISATLAASVRLEQLGDLLRARAGIHEPGPSKRFLHCPPDEQPTATQATGDATDRQA